MERADDNLQQLLDSLDPATRTLVAEVDLGGQAQDFLRSDLGRHLIGCLHQEVVLAQEELAKVAAWRWRRIRDLQNRIWRAQFMLSWLRDLLVGGRSAQGALEQGEDHG